MCKQCTLFTFFQVLTLLASGLTFLIPVWSQSDAIRRIYFDSIDRDTGMSHILDFSRMFLAVVALNFFVNLTFIARAAIYKEIRREEGLGGTLIHLPGY